MQKRIFTNFAVLIITCVVLLAVSFGVLFYRAAQTHEMSAVRDKAYLIAGLFNQETFYQGTFEYIENLETGGTRITIISRDGWVLSDSHPSTDISINRGDRAEFIQAKAQGSGEAIRSSDTLGVETFYYAIRLTDGSVLRLSRTLYSLGEVLISTLPALFVVTFIILILAQLIAHRLTLNIIKPFTEADFESLKDRASQQAKAETHRKEFTANVSHELRTPLTTISALAEMIANGMAKPEDITEFSGKISNHAKRLVNIIDDIIRLSEFDESKVEKDFAFFDIYELAKTVIGNLQDKAAEKSVKVELTGQPQNIKANSRLLDELMYNLVENGIKYNKEGGNVNLSISEDESRCKITVADTGIGIAKEHQSRVFERFYRADNSRSKKTGGTGLGLSIVKHIVEHHKGKITINSNEGEGTSIVCYIPIDSNMLN